MPERLGAVERHDRSLGEVAALCRRAMRGAGAGWSTADEVGYAAARLCAWGLDGCGTVVSLCRAVARYGAPLIKPSTLTTSWQAPEKAMCSVCCGLALSDTPHSIPQGLQFRDVAAPLIMVPFVQLAAQARQGNIGLNTATLQVVCTPDGISCAGTLPSDVADVSLVLDAAPGPLQQVQSRAQPDRDTWATLEELASHTYAPATEESRAKGAG